MKYSFGVKDAKSETDSLTFFTCFFKSENVKFIFSTGKKIKLINWDNTNQFIVTTGKQKTKFSESVKIQLNRYSNLFVEAESLYSRINEDFTSKTLDGVFDEEF
jgi:formylmethanofuran dehydrogenase subunit E-like metal-binding protein